MCYENAFRTLKANEIECRVARTGKNKKGVWASLLLYKDARVDQKIMDETYGPMNWQASYEMIDGKMFCKVSIWDTEKKCWVSKMNVGSESNTEKDKGLASDCLKRACFTWGLGVELYSSPKIYIGLNDGEFSEKNDRINVEESFKVAEIGYNAERKIDRLVLVDSKGNVRFELLPDTKMFTSDDGKVLRINDSLWAKAVKKTAAGATCYDGTPIPIWLADTYHIDNETMQIFINQVKALKDGNA